MDSKLQMHKLTADSPDVITMLPKVLALSNNVFSADPNTYYASQAVWEERLARSSSVIIYMTPTTGASTDPVGFLFAHPRKYSPPLLNGDTESLYIWMAGVLPEWRKSGSWGAMVEELIKERCGGDEGAKLLTICTVPDMFPNMWNWLLKRGWTVEKKQESGKILLSKSPV